MYIDTFIRIYIIQVFDRSLDNEGPLQCHVLVYDLRNPLA